MHTHALSLSLSLSLTHTHTQNPTITYIHIVVGDVAPNYTLPNDLTQYLRTGAVGSLGCASRVFKAVSEMDGATYALRKLDGNVSSAYMCIRMYVYTSNVTVPAKCALFLCVHAHSATMEAHVCMVVHVCHFPNA